MGEWKRPDVDVRMDHIELVGAFVDVGQHAKVKCGASSIISWRLIRTRSGAAAVTQVSPGSSRSPRRRG